MSHCLVEFTAAAIAHIKSMIARQKGARGFRLAVKDTGCSGKAYVPSIVCEVPEGDIHFIAGDGLEVYLDRASESLLKDLKIDYVEDGTGLRQKRLVYINPHEKGRCGCGESFTV